MRAWLYFSMVMCVGVMLTHILDGGVRPDLGACLQLAVHQGHTLVVPGNRPIGH